MTKLPRPLQAPSAHALRAISLGVLLAWAGAQTQAQTLSELVAQARGYDASWQAQQADARAAASRADQALSGLLPNVGLSAGANRTHVDIHTSVPIPGMASSFNNTQQNVQLSAQQPLYRPANKIAYEQGQRGVDVAQAQLDAAAQNLIVRVAQAYFDVLAAQDSVQVAQSQKQAISTQLEMAKRNFEVGTATITDSREAQSRFDLVTAQEIAAQNDLQVKRVALDQLVGRVGIQPTPLAAPLTLPRVEPDNMQDWVDKALAAQPQLRQAQLALDIARLDTQKAEAGHKPTVDLQAGYVVNRYPNGSMTPSIPLSYRTNAAQIGVVMNMPLFAGFAVQNRIRETVALEEKARAQLDDARRNVEQATRTAFLGVQSGQAQVKALEAALASSQSALEANKMGYEVGVRINIDVLNAQSQVYQTERDLANARYQVLLGQLKLRQATGVLSDDDLRMIDALTRTPSIAPAAAARPAVTSSMAAAKPAARTFKR
ncbi:TolC family outer membrane protein [Comamonas thiooxydans]|uniref:TolC family outer membrane protein n=1 Tax=Comamonas thiooxydans TaxID=363952 RepID=UPI000A2DF6DB|nr:TolC family outer membrane protein [Comamonas thiooxydans]BDR09115.1 TolC family outer membrane protein [Comamonas thiooxydans]